MDKVTREKRKLHNEEFNVYSPNINLRRMRWVRHIARMAGEDRCIQSCGVKT